MSGERKFITYEEPLAGKVFTERQMHEVYRDMADKNEYPYFWYNKDIFWCYFFYMCTLFTAKTFLNIFYIFNINIW